MAADLVRLRIDLDLSQHKALTRRKRRHDMGSGLSLRLRAGTALGLAINGDRLDRRADQRRDPGDEATLERLRVETGEDVAEMVMRRRAVFEQLEPAKKYQFRLAKLRDGGDRLRARDHSRKAEKKNFVQGITDLAALTWIVHRLEIFQKNHALVNRQVGHALGRVRSHIVSPQPESDESHQFRPSRTMSRGDSPDCPNVNCHFVVKSPCRQAVRVQSHGRSRQHSASRSAAAYRMKTFFRRIDEHWRFGPLCECAVRMWIRPD